MLDLENKRECPEAHVAAYCKPDATQTTRHHVSQHPSSPTGEEKPKTKRVRADMLDCDAAYPHTPVQMLHAMLTLVSKRPQKSKDQTKPETP